MSNLHTDLLALFETKDNLNRIIQAIASDRITRSTTTLTLLTQLLDAQLRNTDIVTPAGVNPQLASSDPLLFILLTMVIEHDKAGMDSTNIRDVAAKAYKEKYNTDDRFEHHYFYSRSPLPFLAHCLLVTKSWNATYDGQMMGIYKGNSSFAPEAIMTAETLQLIEAEESPVNKSFPSPFRDSLTSRDDGNYVVKNKVTSPLMGGSIGEQLDRMYTAARRTKQIFLLEEYIHHLKQTSDAIARLFVAGPVNNALVLIGPYGCGKTTYANAMFNVQEDKGMLISLSSDALTAHLRESFSEKASRSDFHFEGCILKEAINNSLFRNLFATGSYTDERRFTQAMNDFFKGRDIKMIEVATEHPTDTVVRFCDREQIKDPTNMMFNSTLTAANEAQVFRQGRINKVITSPQGKNDLTYTLLCNRNSSSGKPDFVVVCEVIKGQLIIHNEDLHRTLMDPSLLTTAEKVMSRLNQKKAKLSSSADRFDFSQTTAQSNELPEKGNQDLNLGPK